VHPKNQGRGIATDLVRSGLCQAEKLGLPVLVMAFDVSRGIYFRLGFREVEQVLQDDTKFGGSGHYNAYFLIWEPQATAAGNSHPSSTAATAS
jgi:predicted N-acetyltransferase YhbS